MRYITLIIAIVFLCSSLDAQDLQTHYDIRRHYPILYFQYFRNQDTTPHLGSFLLKVQADLRGHEHNVGEAYVQVSQSVRFWKAPIFVSLQYSGGLGTGYYINNAYNLSLSIPFQWKGAWLSALAGFRYSGNACNPMITFYWWKGLFRYKLEFAGDWSVWTETRQLYFFAEPQIWYNVGKAFAVGVKVVYTNSYGAYPTMAIRWKL